MGPNRSKNHFHYINCDRTVPFPSNGPKSSLRVLTILTSPRTKVPPFPHPLYLIRSESQIHHPIAIEHVSVKRGIRAAHVGHHLSRSVSWHSQHPYCRIGGICCELANGSDARHEGSTRGDNLGQGGWAGGDTYPRAWSQAWTLKWGTRLPAVREIESGPLNFIMGYLVCQMMRWQVSIRWLDFKDFGVGAAANLHVDFR